MTNKKVNIKIYDQHISTIKTDDFDVHIFFFPMMVSWRWSLVSNHGKKQIQSEKIFFPFIDFVF